MSLYPPKVLQAAKAALAGRSASDPDGEGVAASFACGCFVRFFVNVRQDDQVVTTNFRSNGCGYMIAASQTLTEVLNEKQLRDLHGLEVPVITQQLFAIVGDFPAERQQCCSLAIDAMAEAFADHRRRQIEEFSGEKVLICTCFGVTEHVIEDLIRQNHLTDVSEVAAACNAGSGCGSCRMLIQEILESTPATPDMV